MSRTSFHPYPLLAAVVLAAIAPAGGEEIYQLPLANPSFADAVAPNGLPSGWSRYAGAGQDQERLLGQ